MPITTDLRLGAVWKNLLTFIFHQNRWKSGVVVHFRPLKIMRHPSISSLIIHLGIYGQSESLLAQWMNSAVLFH